MSPIVKYDRDADAAYVRYSADKVVESEEVADVVVLDYDRDGRIVGIEVLEARRHLSPAVLERAGSLLRPGGALSDTGRDSL